MKILVTNRFYYVLLALIAGFFLAFFASVIRFPLELIASVFLLVLLADLYVLLFTGTLEIERECADRFSNGDDNAVTILLTSFYPNGVQAQVIDEVPFQFQWRDFSIQTLLEARKIKQITYQLRPTERGVYAFGHVIVLVKTRFGLLQRKFKGASPQAVKVYPSFVRLHQYELMAISQNLTLQGEKRVRKVGNSREFDTIKDYVTGDDPRKINWAATARRGHLMTNHYIDERAQNVYCLIDKSRSMKMPFEQMTLLDYAINASLVISNIALKKGDLAGLLTFEDKVDTFNKASNRGSQIYQIMESLYHQETSFKEIDLAAVHTFAQRNINQRSLLLMFTNFESIHSLQRQLPFLRLLNKKHLLIVVYFRNTEVDKLLENPAKDTREIYNQSIARQHLEEKLLIRDELSRAGILSLYTAPQNLNVDVINKYVEVKAKRML